MQETAFEFMKDLIRHRNYSFLFCFNLFNKKKEDYQKLNILRKRRSS